MVPRGLELRTFRLLAERSDQLSYETSWGRLVILRTGTTALTSKRAARSRISQQVSRPLFPGALRAPYRVECTGSLLTSEVTLRRARLVLGRGTAWAAWLALLVASTVFAVGLCPRACLPLPVGHRLRHMAMRLGFNIEIHSAPPPRALLPMFCMRGKEYRSPRPWSDLQRGARVFAAISASQRPAPRSRSMLARAPRGQGRLIPRPPK